MKIFKILVLVPLVFLGTSCDSFLELKPVNVISDDVVIVDNASAQAAVFGIYSRIQTAGLYGNQMILNPGVLSDELTHSGSFPTIKDMDNSSVVASNVTVQGTWQAAYTGIYQANIVIEALSSGNPLPGLTDANRALFLAEARFLRAMMHFDLLKLHGGIPLAITSELAVLRTLPRSSAADCYAFIDSELTAIIPSLEGVDNGNFRINEWAAKGLLARVKLYNGDLAGAGALANDVIQNGGYTLETDYASLFTSAGGANEVIFRVFFSALDQNGIPFQTLPEGRFEFAVSPQLLAAYEADDERRLVKLNGGDAAGRFATTKYPDVSTGTSPTIILRLAEMKLIRAEANLVSNNGLALTDVNDLRLRAGLTALPGPLTLDDVMDERFVELAAEGHRWNDLIRTGRVNTVMAAINPTTWTPDKTLLPIPQYEIQQNPSLAGSQNPGY
jgi:hypothetical protein